MLHLRAKITILISLLMKKGSALTKLSKRKLNQSQDFNLRQIRRHLEELNNKDHKVLTLCL